MNMAFNENTRVKIPAILHLCRLGYKYVSLKGANIDFNTNIFIDIFNESISSLNPEMEADELKRVREDITMTLDNEDLGEAFYKMLTTSSDTKLIDFSDFNNNSFHVVTELTYKNGEEEFRPDITLLINGMPLAFIEVKKPNNQEGVLAERDRINVRFKNKKFRKFINMTQLLVFSNNMKYDIESIEPIQGAFYSSCSYNNANFNCFREEEKFDLSKILLLESEVSEDLVLKDNNLNSIKHSNEFITNKSPETPTNSILTSLFQRERLAMLLKYGIAYVRGNGTIEKHIMRYPQFFATKAIEYTIDSGVKKGIIWHTQGSGKTALSYYNVQYLTDYFKEKKVIPKFYFIVDRIDLMNQAKLEFKSRGLTVVEINSKEDLQKNFSKTQAIHNLSGKAEITVVNIQKFKDDTDALKINDYDISTQRVYFLDEVHRSYNPTGSFLANLINSDREAIMIGLTGTPLIRENRKSTGDFGKYIHKYYYNDSIADGYTLKLIREGIETSYKMQMESALKELEVLKGMTDKSKAYAHKSFVSPMLDYIVTDFLNSRIRFGDNSIGAMVVCDSSDQAKKLFEIFSERYSFNSISETEENYKMVAEENILYNQPKKILRASLILHDIGDKESRKQDVEEFKEGKIDILFVYNMLLTGFDAKRLKKLYIGRIIKDHNLLQTLTRVNRPYKKFRYGYVVDFADIRTEFESTNKAYFNELQEELGDELKTYSNLFKSKEEIAIEIEEIKDKLFHYNLENSEVFSQQINEIFDRKTVLDIKKALENAKNLYNIIKTTGQFEMLEKLDFKKLNDLYREATKRLELLNFKDSIENSNEATNLLNFALEDVIFKFTKISEEEMLIADKLKSTLRKTREALQHNIDQKDPEFISLYEELKRIFSKKNLDEISQDEMRANIGSLEMIFDKITELNRKNALLKEKYANDTKYTRVHKRIMEKGKYTKQERQIFETLMEIKNQTDQNILSNSRMLNNESYFEKLLFQAILNNFEEKIDLDMETAKYINTCLAKEYLQEHRGE